MPVLQSVFKRRYEIAEERMEICRECEFLEKRYSQCEKCGCFMEYKTLLFGSECPIGKWKAINTDNNNEEETS